MLLNFFLRIIGLTMQGLFILGFFAAASVWVLAMMVLLFHGLTGGETWLFPDPLFSMTVTTFAVTATLLLFSFSVKLTPRATWSNKWSLLTHETL